MLESKVLDGPPFLRRGQASIPAECLVPGVKRARAEELVPVFPQDGRDQVQVPGGGENRVRLDEMEQRLRVSGGELTEAPETAPQHLEVVGRLLHEL